MQLAATPTGLRGTRSSSLARVLLCGQLQQLYGMGNIEAGPQLPGLVEGLGVTVSDDCRPS
jgi:hypothetical protein